MVERSSYVSLLQEIRNLHHVGGVNVYCCDIHKIQHDMLYEYTITLSVEVKVAGNWYGQYRIPGKFVGTDQYETAEGAKYMALYKAITEIEALSRRTLMN